MFASRGLHVIGIPPDVVKTLAKVEPSFLVSSYPKGYLGLLEKAVPALGFRVVLYAYEEIADGVVYDLLKSLNEHPKELRAGYPMAAAYGIRSIPWETKIPFHPGAIKFYKHLGIWDAKAKALQESLLSGK